VSLTCTNTSRVKILDCTRRAQNPSEGILAVPRFDSCLALGALLGMDYYPVIVKQHPRTTPKRSPESKYWRRFKNPVFIKDTAPVTSIHFSPCRPHQYAVTSGARIQVFATKTQKVIKTVARFKDTARSANIRSDGKLLVAGDDSGLVQARATRKTP
jgi:hypothetical protein